MTKVLGAMLVVLAAAPAAAAHAAIDVDDQLTLTRADGDEVEFPARVRVWCGRWEPDVEARALHVRIGRPGKGAFWWLRAVVADVRREPVVRLPHSFVFDRPTGAQLFAVDGTNELSSAEEEASGRIVFRRARCGRRLAVRVRVDATLGSELSDGEPLTVTGSFAARVTR